MHTTKWRTSYSEQDKRDIYYFKTFANLHHYYHLSSTSIPLTYGKIVRWWPMKEGGRRKKEEGRRRGAWNVTFSIYLHWHQSINTIIHCRIYNL
jgi:hypothetical protein